MTYKDLERLCEFGNGVAVTLGSKTRMSTYNRLADRAKDLNIDWLIYGQGEMLREPADTPSEVPLLPIVAEGGKLTDFAPGITRGECETIASPMPGAELAMRLHGESMSPRIPSGAIVYLRRATTEAIEWGKVYVIDTPDGAVCKVLRRSSDTTKVRCCSINPDYDDYEIERPSKEQLFIVRYWVVCQ